MSPDLLGVVLFYACAGVAVASAVVVVAQKSPTYSALALIVTLCALSVIFALLGSPFIAALQVIVYAGAIMVLFLFVMMLLNVRSEEPPPGRGVVLPLAGLGLVALLAVQVGSVILRAVPAGPARFRAPTHEMARVLFSTQYLYVFEATSILILAALVGAVALAKRDL